MDLKQTLTEIGTKLAEVETAARELKNKNFADIALSAKGRVAQLVDHPDLHLMQEDHTDVPPAFDPKAGVTRDGAASDKPFSAMAR